MIDVVHLVEVDPVGLQPGKTPFTVLANLVGTQAGAVAVHFGQIRFAIDWVINLCRKHNGVAATTALRQPPPDNFLGQALFDRPTVDVGRVEEIDPEFEGPVHNPEAVLFGGVPAKVHRAETDIAYQDAVIA
jgi:hypothetical protein